MRSKCFTVPILLIANSLAQKIVITLIMCSENEINLHDIMKHKFVINQSIPGIKFLQISQNLNFT
jgi:hypothetical protein